MQLAARGDRESCCCIPAKKKTRAALWIELGRCRPWSINPVVLCRFPRSNREQGLNLAWGGGFAASCKRFSADKAASSSRRAQIEGLNVPASHSLSLPNLDKGST